VSIGYDFGSLFSVTNTHANNTAIAENLFDDKLTLETTLWNVRGGG